MTRKRICIVAAGLTLLIFGGLYLAFTILEQRDRVKSENMESHRRTNDFRYFVTRHSDGRSVHASKLR